MRKGNYKLSKRMYYDKLMLFDLEEDKGEIYDISNDKPELVKELKIVYNDWEAEMMDPLWTNDMHMPATKKRLDEYNEIRQAASNGERKN